MLELSARQARHVALATQGLHTRQQGGPSALTALHRLGCIQLDTISVVRRSHELVQLARGVPLKDAQDLITETDPPVLFEYWAHAASLVPLEHWPLFSARRRRYAVKGWSGPAVDAAACDHVLSVLDERGAVTVSDVGGAQGSGWERSSVNKWALEWLLATGEIACVHRRGWQRVYQLTTAVIPPHLRKAEPNDTECLSGLTALAIEALGIATTDDVADYFRLPARSVARHLEALPGIQPARVEGWTEPAWITEQALDCPLLDEDACTPLSPFDSLLWYRPRMRRLFGVEYLLEAYKPAVKRECGYFGMPVLAGDRIVGRLAVRVSKSMAVIEGHQLIRGCDPAHLQHALNVICQWAGAAETPTLIPSAPTAGATP